jgi:hypothetical protein
MTVTISQDAEVVDLAWVEGDPLSLAFTVAAVDWSGTYTAKVKQYASDTAALLTLTVTATYSAPDTAFTMTATAAANTVPAGGFVWDLQQTGGVTRLRGKVRVEAQVTT